MTQNGKPLATALYKIEPHFSEVTATILLDNGENHHETHMIDINRSNYFSFRNKSYHMPPSQAEHYPHGFWDFPRRLGNFYEQHKTLGSLFDWFHFRKNLAAEIGFLYKENQTEPLTLEPRQGKFDLAHNQVLDWALINFHLKNNSSIEDAMKDAHDKLKGHQDTPLSTWILIFVGIFAIVAVIVLISTYTGNHAETVKTAQNITLTPSPSVFRGGP